MRRLQRFWGWCECCGDGRGEFERVARLVVGDRDVEGVEEVGELGWAGTCESGAEVRDRCQEGFDLMGLGRVGAFRFELAAVVFEGCALMVVEPSRPEAGEEVLRTRIDRCRWVVLARGFFDLVRLGWLAGKRLRRARR